VQRTSVGAVTENNSIGLSIIVFGSEDGVLIKTCMNWKGGKTDQGIPYQKLEGSWTDHAEQVHKSPIRDVNDLKQCLFYT